MHNLNLAGVTRLRCFLQCLVDHAAGRIGISNGEHGLMANLAAKQIKENSNASRMRDAHKRLLGFKDDGGTAAFLDERRSFYDTIVEIGGNHELKRILPLMQIHLLRMQFQSYITPRDREQQFKEYQAIADSILSGNAARAEKTAALHIRRTRLSLKKLPDEAFPTIRQ
jgi:DNA-binding GntR family transcriptional regulator